MVTFNVYHPSEDNNDQKNRIQKKHNKWASKHIDKNVPTSNVTEPAYVSIEYEGEVISLLIFTIIGKSKNGDEGWWRSVGERHNGYKTELPTEEVNAIQHEITEFIKKIGDEVGLSYFIYHQVDSGVELHNDNRSFKSYSVKNILTRFIIPCQEYGIEFRGNGTTNPNSLEENITTKTGLTTNVTTLSKKSQIIVEIPYDSSNRLKFTQGSDEFNKLINTVTSELSNKNISGVNWNIIDEGSLLKKTREGEPLPTQEEVYSTIEELL